MANDFMKWRIRTSLRLLGMPQRKNKTVTRRNGRSCPAGNKWDPARASGREESVDGSACENLDKDRITAALELLSAVDTARSRAPEVVVRAPPRIAGLYAPINHTLRTSLPVDRA